MCSMIIKFLNELHPTPPPSSPSQVWIRTRLKPIFGLCYLPWTMALVHSLRMPAAANENSDLGIPPPGMQAEWSGSDVPLEMCIWAGIQLLRLFFSNPADSHITLLHEDNAKASFWKGGSTSANATQHKYELLELFHNVPDFVPATFKDMMGSMFTVFETVLENIKIGHLSGAQTTATEGSTPRKWPPTVLSILEVIRLALPHCPSLAMAASNSPAFWEALVDECKWATDNMETDSALTGIESEDLYDDRPCPLLSIKTITLLIQNVNTTFIDSLHQNIHSSALIPYARTIYDLLLKFLIRVQTSPEKRTLDGMCFIVNGLCLSLFTAMPRDHPQHPRSLHRLHRAHSQLFTGGDFCGVYSVITRLTKSVAKCCSAACVATSETSAQKLRYCVQCEVMRYCSGTCQKAVWKYHKRVCKDLHTLKKEVLPRAERKNNPRSNLDGAFNVLLGFETEARRHGFTEERMKELVDELTPFLHFQAAE
ncbi:hypothetical protein C8R43DRAFT_961150 [Mycena crocata]|nr:hypothetical protein C8R43DRAFT_961150 [Mycena crocata]